MALCNLGIGLGARARVLRSIEDLNEAISYNQDALELLPDGYPERAAVMTNLGYGYETKVSLARRQVRLR